MTAQAFRIYEPTLRWAHGTYMLSAVLLLIHLKQLDVVHPAPEGGDIGGQRIEIDAFGAEDDDVLALVGRNFDCPFDDLIQSLLVDGFAIGLIIAETCVNNQLTWYMSGSMVEPQAAVQSS